MGKKRVLLVLLLATLAVTLLLLLWAWTGGTGEPSGGPSVPFLASTAVLLPTAEEALGPAREAAQGWQPDVRLVGVSASWNRASRETLLAGPKGWSFLFYSPTAGEIRYVGVGPEGAALGRQFPAPTPPETLEGWQFPAADVLLVFLASGGERYLRERPAAAVHIRLEAESGQAIWTVLAVEGDKEPFVLRIDAVTGEPMP